MPPILDKHESAMAKICIIGISGFGRAHYDYLLEAVNGGRAEAVAATVINRDEEQECCARLESLGCALYTDYRAMLASHRGGCDLCMIPTPIHLHAPMTMAALRSGMNVLVEKPAAAIIQQVRAMQRAERETGRIVAVGYQTLYDPLTLQVKRALQGGVVGRVQSVAAQGIWARAESYYRRNDWAGRLQVGEHWVLDSPMHNALSHYLNLACFLVGEGLGSSCRLSVLQAELYRANDIESCDTAFLRFETQAGIRAVGAFTHACEGHKPPVIEVRGSHGVLRWRMGEIPEIRQGNKRTALSDLSKPSDRPDVLGGVLQRLRDPGHFVCTLDIAAVPVSCVNAAHESSRVNRVPDKWVRFGERDGQRLRIVQGMEELVDQAFVGEKLPTELGVPWAEAGDEVDIGEYEAFEGARK